MNLARERRQRIGLVGVPIFLGLVLLLAALGLRRFESQARAQSGEALQALARTSQAALHAWFESEQHQARQWARDPRLASALEELLQTPRTAELLRASRAVAELQRMFGPPDPPAGRLGFQLLAPDGTVLAASHVEELGAAPPEAFSPELIGSVLSGRCLFVPASGAGAAPSVAIAAPVPDGPMARAVLSLRYATTGGFSRVLQLGRQGRSGEVYALDRTGRLLSESRFTPDLIRLGLLPEGEKASLFLRLSDPGEHPSRAAAEHARAPLTRMAASAVQGESGLDVSGYRDYRGQRVLGAWLWDADLQLGLASEIDEAEALAGYRDNRDLVLGLLGFVGGLALLLLGWVLLEGRRATRELRAARDEWQRLAGERTRDLEQSEAQFRGLFEGSQDAVVLSSGLRLVACNPAALRLFGYDSVESLCALAIEELSPPAQPGGRAFRALLAEQLAGVAARASEPVERVFRRRDGSELCAEVRLSPVVFGEQPAIQAVIRDISARKQAEEALRTAKEEAEAATRAKSLFLANISHEIRTPMHAILGYTQLLRRDAQLGPEREQQLAAIQRSGDHLLGLIEQVLEISRSDAGRSALVRAPFDLGSLLRSLEPSFQQAAQSKGVQLLLELEPGLVRHVEGDARKLSQVVQHLFGNAVRCTDSGRISVRASSRAISPGRCRVMISVADTGTGVASAERERIFEAFQHPDEALRRGGPGLGLALSRSIARAMSGDVTLESTQGQGSTFTFQCELGVGAAPTGAEPRPEPGPAAAAPRAPAPALSELMQGMSGELREQLRDAARQARAQRIGELADRVAEQSHEAAARIRELADEYRYDSLLRALDAESPE